MSRDEEFQQFARSRLQALYRSAYFLCGDAHTAEDLVQETLTRVYLAWGRRIDNHVAYAHTTLTRTFLSAKRRRSSAETPTELPQEGGYVDPDVAGRLDLQATLDELSPLDRAIVVLRYLEDLPVDAVADAVHLSAGNVRVRAHRALAPRATHAAGSTHLRQRLVDRAKLVLARDLARRWTLDEVASEVGVSPVYLTQSFRDVEGVPLYRYQLRLRLARALDLLREFDDLTALGLHLGFSSHSHFTAAFQQAYGRTPSEFRQAALHR